MKASTSRQLANAIASATGPATWVVMQGAKAENMKASSRMTYREAKALARIAREAGMYATVQRAA